MILHQPAKNGDEPEYDLEAPSRTARIGLILFVIYAVFYAGFVFLNAFAPAQMDRTPFAGLNVAILYGFALIVLAFVMSIIYGFLCWQRS